MSHRGVIQHLQFLNLGCIALVYIHLGLLHWSFVTTLSPHYPHPVSKNAAKRSPVFVEHVAVARNPTISAAPKLEGGHLILKHAFERSGSLPRPLIRFRFFFRPETRGFTLSAASLIDPHSINASSQVAVQVPASCRLYPWVSAWPISVTSVAQPIHFLGI